MILWGPDFPDPDANVVRSHDYAANLLPTANAWNDAAIASKSRDVGAAHRCRQTRGRLQEITDYVLHNGPYVILYQSTENFGLRSNVKGFCLEPIGWNDFAPISK